MSESLGAVGGCFGSALRPRSRSVPFGSAVSTTGACCVRRVSSPPRERWSTPLPPVSYEDATTEKNENGRTTRVEPQHGFTTQKQGSKETTGGKKNLMFEKLELESWKGGHHHQYTSTPTGNGRMGDREWARMKWKFPMGVKDGAFFPRIFF